MAARPLSKRPLRSLAAFIMDSVSTEMRRICREGYKDAEAMIEQLGSVAALIDETLRISDITRVEVHGPESQLALLREPLAGLKPKFFTLEVGFRR